MLTWLFERLAEYYGVFSVFQYITFRAILSVLTALVLSFVFGPMMIRKLNQYQIGQTVRDDGPPTHFSKVGTPTMGGALILFAVVVATLLWMDLSNRYLWVTLFVTFSFGCIGWYDDYQKLVNKDPRGMGSKTKFLSQSLAGFIAAYWLYATAVSPQELQFIVPLFKNVAFNMGWLFIPLTWFVIVGSSNAVNLTDGLDGLAILPVVMVTGGLGVFSYMSGNTIYSEYLSVPYLAGAGEMLIFCAALVGAGLGFLWFNAYPAQVFMGDIGSLSLGAALGVLAVIGKHEILLVLVGGLFVLETLSVIIQVLSFRLFGKRVFLMAPLHHHFEKKGWPEPKIIVRFWIISIILVLISLSTLKLR